MVEIYNLVNTVSGKLMGARLVLSGVLRRKGVTGGVLGRQTTDSNG